ncbi:hypothetical protein D3C87_2088450 [compost metagenome]
MRVLFILILLANLWALALGQGWLGVRPEDDGRDTRRFSQELNPGAVTLVPRSAALR